MLWRQKKLDEYSLCPGGGSIMMIMSISMARPHRRRSLSGQAGRTAVPQLASFPPSPPPPPPLSRGRTRLGQESSCVREAPSQFRAARSGHLFPRPLLSRRTARKRSANVPAYVVPTGAAHPCMSGPSTYLSRRLAPLPALVAGFLGARASGQGRVKRGAKSAHALAFEG